MMAVFPFYSIIPGSRGTIDSPPLLPWVPEPVLCLSLRRLSVSLYLIISSFCCCFFESPWLTFHSGVCLGSYSQFHVPQKLFTFSDSAFGCPPSLSFFPSEQNPFSTRSKVFPATSLYSFSFWVPRGTTLLHREWLL